MSIQKLARRFATAHVIVLGNEKGGSGKSTAAINVAVALMNAGQRVATIDLDSRQMSLTHFIENRRRWARRERLDLKIPVHFCIARGSKPTLDENESIEFADFADAVKSAEQAHEFIVIDTPSTDSYLMRLAHSMADTLITPLNDSFVDFDVLGAVDPTTFAVIGESHYAEMVREARRHRRLIDGTQMDWIVVRNRLSVLGSRNKQLVGEGLNELATRLGFRCVDGFAERVVFREFFPRGLSALDRLNEEVLGTPPTHSHLSAGQEVMNLVAALKLPVDERGMRRAAARAEWFSTQNKPLEVHDILQV